MSQQLAKIVRSLDGLTPYLGPTTRITPEVGSPPIPASWTIWYTIWSMGRREVLVQLDDDLVTQLDQLASERGTSRSELLRRGAVAVLDAADLRRADDELQAAYRRIPQDPGVVDMATRLAAATMPEW
jgi:hypothetical protein